MTCRGCGFSGLSQPLFAMPAFQPVSRERGKSNRSNFELFESDLVPAYESDGDSQQQRAGREFNRKNYSEEDSNALGNQSP
jgi:hypothetical protein